MKKILGLDLGVGSIGWALIEVDDAYRPNKILGTGSRIVPLTPDESKSFKGDGESVCSKRTFMRTARKTLDRSQLRRGQLNALLEALGIEVGDDLMRQLSPLELWGLRAKAVTAQVTLAELGRVLLHINHKRGYRHSRTDASEAKQTKYVAEVNANYKRIQDLSKTIGQYVYDKMKDTETEGTHGGKSVSYEYKHQVYPRQAYREEVKSILSKQKEFYPDVLTAEVVDTIVNIIFYQRPLKSCKHLVSYCEFDNRQYLDANGEQKVAKLKVAPKTSPLAQVVRIWENINNIRLRNPHNRGKTSMLQPSLFDDESFSKSKDVRLLQEEYVLNLEEKQRIFEYLNTHAKITQTELLKQLGLKNADGFKLDKLAEKGLVGNVTYVALNEALGDMPGKESLLEFNLESGEEVDKETGEIRKYCKSNYIDQPLYRLWHVIYSIHDEQELANVLRNKFGIDDDEVIARLCAIDFGKAGYASRSAKFMRRLLPYLEQGMMYSEAAAELGINHSSSITKEENANRELKERLELLGKGELRQPVVEKILNQMINVVNCLIEQYGSIDEARVELARELRQNKEKRSKAYRDINNVERDNKAIAALISSEYGLHPSRSRIQKYRMWRETGHKCMYCGQPVSAAEFLSGNGVEVEHIIPRSLFFDDGFTNKTCSCRKCNDDKNNRTAYDYMASQGEEALTVYVKRVEEMWNNGTISKTKRDRLLTPGDKIPDDFLNRDLTLTQYIARKAVEILKNVIRDVWATSGRVTDFFRHSWGYDEILHDLNLESFAKADRVVEEEYTHAGATHKRLRIQDWSKRLDHRHHAIDAITVALTRQAYIQKLNNLNRDHDTLFDEVVDEKGAVKERSSLLTQWGASRPHFSVAEVKDKIDGVVVSDKTKKKLTTPGKRFEYKGGKRILRQSGLNVPRGEMHEQTIYGKIKLADTFVDVKKAFDMIDRIANPKIKQAIETRINENKGDIKLAKKTLKNSPIVIKTRNNGDTIISTVRVYADYIVTRKDVSTLRYQDVDKIIDSAVRRLVKTRYDECGQDQKKYQNSLKENPLCLHEGDAPVSNVRIKTTLKSDSLVGTRKDNAGNVIGFAKTGNNHHVAIYRDEKGRVQTYVVSFWEAIKRKNLGLPVVVTSPSEAWDKLVQMEDCVDIREVAMNLPAENMEYVLSMRIGDKFIMGMSDDEYADAVASNDTTTLAHHLYYVQKLSDNDYFFRLHNEANAADEKTAQSKGTQLRLASFRALMSMNPRKVNVDILGNIIV